MQLTPAEKPRLSFCRAFFWPLVAFAIAGHAILQVSWTLYEFYRDTAMLPPGTGIRPLGPVIYLGFTATYSVLAGGFCSLAGVAVGFRRRRLMLVLAALATLSLSFAPWLVGFRAFNQIVAARKLVIEP
jgi:hypothetical protein